MSVLVGVVGSSFIGLAFWIGVKFGRKETNTFVVEKLTQMIDDHGLNTSNEVEYVWFTGAYGPKANNDEQIVFADSEKAAWMQRERRLRYEKCFIASREPVKLKLSEIATNQFIGKNVKVVNEYGKAIYRIDSSGVLNEIS